jgi:uncharacterized heparinase superfamily protein
MFRRVKKIALYGRTVRHLKVTQIVNRILRKITFSAVQLIVPPLVNECSPNIDWVTKKHSILGVSEFCFLNKRQRLNFPGDWQNTDLPLLWMYNLHYFDGLLAVETSENVKEKLVESWLTGNVAQKGVAWEPYPTSLRIVNWIKWQWSRRAKAQPEFNLSLANQLSHLNATLEYHLLGNHLLENAKALIFGGCYFDGDLSDKWLAKGLEIIDRELDEQILADGAHFELSPMYHIIIFELLLDLLNLSKQDQARPEIKVRREMFFEISSKMSAWLDAMVHPDGGIPYFNDASSNISLKPVEAQNYWLSLGGRIEVVKDQCCHYLSSSGYLRLQDAVAVVLVDLAEIGPAYLPGHGHADTLSMEFSVFGMRVIGNLGTSEYGSGLRRSYERSTAAHSTLAINGEDSSEVWGGFRVGRRAKVSNVEITCSGESHTVTAEHNGYRHLVGKPKHKRIIDFSSGELTITDVVSAGGLKSIARFHLHPTVTCEVEPAGDRGQFILPNGHNIKWIAKSAVCSVVRSVYASEFGLLTETTTLELVQLIDRSSLQLCWE